ncbi:hypothetical protein SUGI_0767780 [Cryptomeria japonica]|nr:hypothetical protein SUGI_0767780 [Cryptomeria japonica]
MGIQCGIVWFILLFQGFAVAQDLQAYIARKEEQVKLMAAEIVRLNEARCEFAANCSSSCSRHACTPIEGFQNPNIYDYQCQKMDFNKYCSASSSGGDCNGSKANYAMSYIRMAPNATTSEVPDEMCSTICMTRDFTSTLKALANVDQYDESFYFSSIEGVHRDFPGVA